MSELDEIRAATLGKPEQFEKRLVKIGERLDGTAIEIEVREPSLLARGRISKVSGAQKGREHVDTLELLLECIVQCCFKPGTDKPAFTEEDKPAMRNRRAGGWVDELSKVALELFNKSAEAAQEQGKNSEGRPSDKSSSESQETSGAPSTN